MKAKEIVTVAVIAIGAIAAAMFVFDAVRPHPNVKDDVVVETSLQPQLSNGIVVATPLHPEPLSGILKGANSPVPRGFDIIGDGTDVVRKGDLVLNHDSGNWVPAEPQELGLKVEGKIHAARAAHDATQ
jgi:hypothetical protein